MEKTSLNYIKITSEENIDKEGGCVVTIPKEDGSVVLHVNISDDFIKELDNNEVPKYIFIDEVTHFNVAELKALDMAAKKYGIKIIAAGDTLQKGATMRSASANIGDIFAWKSPALTISVRAGNSWKKGNIDLIQQLLRKTEKVINEQGFKKDYIDAELNQVKTISYYQTDSELHGDKLVGSITVDDLKVIKKASAGGKSVMIISNVDANGDLTDKALENKLKEAGFNKSDLTKIK